MGHRTITAKDYIVEEQGGFVGWIVGIGGLIVTTLSGLVAMFYREQIAEHKAARAKTEAKVIELEKRADTCDDERGSLEVRCAVLEERAAATDRIIADMQASKASHQTVQRKIDELKQ